MGTINTPLKNILYD